MRVEMAASVAGGRSAARGFNPNAPTIEDEFSILADVPREEWDRLPADLSEHLDHYIYGTPK